LQNSGKRDIESFFFLKSNGNLSISRKYFLEKVFELIWVQGEALSPFFATFSKEVKAKIQIKGGNYYEKTLVCPDGSYLDGITMFWFFSR
jgi:hypothetical protein